MLILEKNVYENLFKNCLTKNICKHELKLFISECTIGEYKSVRTFVELAMALGVFICYI
jgi:hypothetical protein